MDSSPEVNVRAVIRHAWADLIPFSPFDETATWEEAGVDLLKMLQVLLRLEFDLKRPLSFEGFTRDTTIGEFIRLVAGDTAAHTTPFAKDSAAFFLLPGVFGDEPRLAEFRRSLQGKVAFRMVALPDIDSDLSVLHDVNAIANLAAADIVARQPSGEIYLAGYSFGSMLAYEVAQRLTAAGRAIGLLCLLDPPPRWGMDYAHAHARKRNGAQNSARRGRFLAALARRPNESVRLYLERIAFHAATRLRLTEAARRLVLANLEHYEFDRGHHRRRAVLMKSRRRAMAAWRPTPCPAPVLIIASNDFAAERAPMWGSLCPNLTIEYVGSTHLTIFDPEPLQRLNPALLAAIARSRPSESAAAVG